MENAETILVIFLSVALAVFLVLGIIFMIKAIRIVNRMERLSTKAEDFVEKVGAVSSSFAAGRLVSRISDMFLNRNEGNKKGRGK